MIEHTGGNVRGACDPGRGVAHEQFLAARKRYPKCRCFIRSANGSFVPDDGLQKGRRWRFENDRDLAKIELEIAKAR